METKFDISRFTPCPGGVKYYAKFNNHKEAWEKCPRGDWMLYIAYELGIDIQVLTLAKGLCANTIRDLMEDERNIKAIDAAIAFGKGEISAGELKAAADSAHIAYDDSDSEDDDTVNEVAISAAAVDYAAYVAAAVTAEVIYDSFDDNDQDHDIVANAAKSANELETANICREILTNAVFERIEQLMKQHSSK